MAVIKPLGQIVYDGMTYEYGEDAGSDLPFVVTKQHNFGFGSPKVLSRCIDEKTALTTFLAIVSEHTTQV